MLGRLTSLSPGGHGIQVRMPAMAATASTTAVTAIGRAVRQVALSRSTRRGAAAETERTPADASTIPVTRGVYCVYPVCPLAMNTSMHSHSYTYRPATTRPIGWAHHVVRQYHTRPTRPTTLRRFNGLENGEM